MSATSLKVSPHLQCTILTSDSGEDLAARLMFACGTTTHLKRLGQFAALQVVEDARKELATRYASLERRAPGLAPPVGVKELDNAPRTDERIRELQQELGPFIAFGLPSPPQATFTTVFEEEPLRRTSMYAP